jgi:AmiR/NasT family two-component response regulator
MQEPVAESGLAGRRVLVVEDEFLIALDVEETLRDLGCEVVGPVATVAEALAIADPVCCDVAVLDVRLVDGSTEPLAVALKERGIPFVVLTGYDRGQVTEPVLREAVLIGKPLQRKALLRALLGCLPAA